MTAKRLVVKVGPPQQDSALADPGWLAIDQIKNAGKNQERNPEGMKGPIHLQRPAEKKRAEAPSFAPDEPTIRLRLKEERMFQRRKWPAPDN